MERLGWKGCALLAMILLSISPFFGVKAVVIHGQKNHYMITTSVFVVFAIYCLLTNDGLHLVTKMSSIYAIVAAIVGTSAFLLVSYSWQTAPNKLPLIMIILSFSATLNALIGHFFGNRLNLRQWICFVGAFMLIAVANWKE